MIQIIESREKDIDALRNLFLKTRLTTFSWIEPSQFKLSDFEKETDGEYILVALDDELLVGFVSVWVADNFVHHLYVDEKYHNKNIGTELLKTTIDKIGLPIRLKCEENNAKAVSFYKQKGFVEKERGQSKNGTYILFELLKELESKGTAPVKCI
ncbi:GNAT family N-acetyltransferase [Fulvivirga ulvae]|uniref:GNAT family N-acetyltransferase n=1 Tax=Fulvivirga ulvae TaxID=2904245 RepID=UPI001F42D752|nr:GNAT family N-acetyltransferase [Fulvivirga ulvae]UII34515.1 GNAT family N-acetyltransferase [Fulvivirga ulvae]